MSHLIEFKITAELPEAADFTNDQANEILSNMEDLILRTSLDLYDSEHDFDEDDLEEA